MFLLVSEKGIYNEQLWQICDIFRLNAPLATEKRNFIILKSYQHLRHTQWAIMYKKAWWSFLERGQLKTEPNRRYRGFFLLNNDRDFLNCAETSTCFSYQQKFSKKKPLIIRSGNISRSLRLKWLQVLQNAFLKKVFKCFISVKAFRPNS